MLGSSTGGCISQPSSVKMRELFVVGSGEGGKRRETAALSRKMFLTVCKSVKDQQRSSEAALICACFQEASGAFSAVVPSHTSHPERDSLRCTSSNRRY